MVTINYPLPLRSIQRSDIINNVNKIQLHYDYFGLTASLHKLK